MEMKSVRLWSSTGVFGLALLSSLSIASGGAPGELELASSNEPPPAELPAELRDALPSQSFKVTSSGELQAEFWFAKEPPSGGMGGMALGVNFNQFPVGGLLGVVRLDVTWRDYKNLPIAPGLYSLRYGQQPADGNHTGITLYRDYAMLVPAGQELGADFAGAQPELDRLSRDSTGTPHPGVMALFPIWDPVDGVQIVPNEIGQPSLVWHFDEVQAGFVLQGHGELEGY